MIYVKHHTYQTDSFYDEGDGEPYGHSWSDTYSFEVQSVHINRPNGQHDVVNIPFGVAVGDEVHVLVIHYGDGDSFGSASGKGEVVWVFANYDLAVAAAHKYERNDDEWNIRFQIDNDESVTLSNPASGYFERLERMEILTCVVQE